MSEVIEITTNTSEDSEDNKDNKDKKDKKGYYWGRLIGKIIENVNENRQFYSIKLLLDMALNIPRIKTSFDTHKTSTLIYALLAGCTVPEMLSTTVTSPKNYRAFLARKFAIKQNDQIIIDLNKDLCSQIHVECDHSFRSCIHQNSLIFKRNLLHMLRFYGKLYVVPLLIDLFGNKEFRSAIMKLDSFHICRKIVPSVTIYAKSVCESSLALSTYYLAAQTYLTIIEQSQIPEKVHYMISLIIGAICFSVFESKKRLGMINRFLLSIYVNMVVYYSTPKQSYDKFKKLWDFVLPTLIVYNVYKRGPVSTLLALF